MRALSSAFFGYFSALSISCVARQGYITTALSVPLPPISYNSNHKRSTATIT
ncbi:hypothetical protein PULV_a2065 [Pseudoalteromonas ulvae UL12]|nr:hypothetical protein [Pseudoalteromonas ulvae UL12]